ncbi:hypothetical protein E2P86_00100 [Sphingobacterium psychroaquaticum]|uniref:hypothetical protein n=1 Tax=Sphingobacterium psychroaquaticum TaxID=561061 RepID=UPI00106C9ECD|nr:hypothetical protein [Sphingobacterium psychroaquaticum]QBQ39650.1 hypothetical protein E2P86_00100 [Sphingobacterium psychroaquaticum]
MDEQNHNTAFSQQLALLLDTIFVTHQTLAFTILTSEDLDVSIVIYSPAAKNRLKTVTSARVIHLDEEYLRKNEEKVLQRIASLYSKGQTIYARETVIARVDKRISMQFLEEHHLNTAFPGKYRYGLFYRGDLVSLAVFSGGRKMKDKPTNYRSFELIRFCHKSGLRVVGGLSRLIRAFAKDFTPGDIMTYVDNDWSQDSSLKTIGFLPTGTLPPQALHFQNISQQTATSTLPIKGEYSKYNSGSTKLVLTL